MLQQKLLQHPAHIDTLAINFTILDNGVAVALSGQTLEVFFRQPEHTTLRIIQNPTAANTDIMLANDGNRVLGFSGNRLYTLSLSE